MAEDTFRRTMLRVVKVAGERAVVNSWEAGAVVPPE
jgi:hypothetical protein